MRIVGLVLILVGVAGGLVDRYLRRSPWITEPYWLPWLSFGSILLAAVGAMVYLLAIYIDKTRTETFLRDVESLVEETKRKVEKRDHEAPRS
jgi:hypothetical protein